MPMPANAKGRHFVRFGLAGFNMSDRAVVAAAADDEPATATPPSAAASSLAARPLAACTRCHERKVKCDVSSAGVPCTNCSKEGIECSLRTRKSYAPRKRRRVDATSEPATVPTANRKPSSSAKSAAQPSMPPPGKTVKTLVKPGPEDEDLHVASPLFVGDAQGIGFDVEAGTTQHLFVDGYIARILGPEELEYLSKKGVFTLPVPHVIECLMRAYFKHVHPMLPVVDAATFLKTYENEGVQSLNLLLLWSMFSASASFINDATLVATGFNKRKTLKESLFKKAKSLFYIGSERDKTVLIQSALLLSLWFVDIQDVFQTWHWSGIAINLSMNLGLHRNPDVWRKNPSFSGRRRQLWRRLWWTCVFRDRWASLSLGRPLRINFEDCDVPLPQESDITAEIQDCGKPIREKYGLCTGLARYWVALMHLTNLLGEVITLNYRPKAPVPSQQKITDLDAAINAAVPVELETNIRTLDASFFLDHLKLHREVVLIVLYRRYIKRSNTANYVDDDSTHTKFNSRENIKTAAGRCNAIVEHIVESNTTDFITASMIPLFAPPMTSHLMEAKALSGVAKKLASSRLDVYLALLSEFEDNYPTAAMLKIVYLSVRDKKSTNLSQELISLRRSESINPFQNHPPTRSTSHQVPPSYVYNQPRSQTWDDIWLLEPFANFHWDALTPEESDKAISFVSSEVYPNVQAPTPAASVLGTTDR